MLLLKALKYLLLNMAANESDANEQITVHKYYLKDYLIKYLKDCT